MSEYDRKFEAALSELEATEMWRSNHSPPALRALRRLGIKARPPHYASFWSVSLSYALWFGPVWGIIMWFATWQAAGFSFTAAAGASALAGLLFGFAMAVYYARGRKKYRLKRWEDL